MIDWLAQVAELKRMADELDLLASKKKGSERVVLGRISDELRRFAGKVQKALDETDESVKPMPLIPDWLTEAIDYAEEEDYYDDEEAYHDDYSDEEY